MKYGWNYYFEPSPRNVSKWLLSGKVVLVVASSSAFVAHSPQAGFYMLLLTVFLGELGNLFGAPPERIENEKKDEV